MKQGLKAIGKAAAYFAVYYLIQIIVSTIYTIVLTTKLTLEMMETEPELNMTLLETQVFEAVMADAMMLTFISGVIVLLIFALVSVIVIVTDLVTIFPKLSFA